MIRLSRLTDYAINLMSYMENDGRTDIWSASGLATRSGLPMPTVAKVLKLLAKGGLLSAQRGAAGGYRLAKLTTQISIAEIIEAMDGPIAITDCSDSHAENKDPCQIITLCPMSAGWTKINDALRQALASVSLAEMSGHHFIPPDNKIPALLLAAGE